MRVCTGYEFDCLADEHGFVVLYPDGYRRNWNDCRKYATFPAKRENIDDMSFIRTMITRVIAEHYRPEAGLRFRLLERRPYGIPLGDGSAR